MASLHINFLLCFQVSNIRLDPQKRNRCLKGANGGIYKNFELSQLLLPYTTFEK